MNHDLHLMLFVCLLGSAGFAVSWGLAKLGHPRLQAAYPPAALVSRWAGILACAVLLLIAIKTLTGSQGDFFFFLGITVSAPVIGVLICGLLRPIAQLGVACYLSLTSDS